MRKSYTSLVLILVMFAACTSSKAIVHGDETLPWGVERIRAYCLWDNDNDTAVDEGANAGSQREKLTLKRAYPLPHK